MNEVEELENSIHLTAMLMRLQVSKRQQMKKE